jgi:hypothetical protein
MPKGEVGKADGLVAILPDPALEELVVRLRTAVEPLVDGQPGSGSPVGDDAVVDPEPPGNQTVTGRHTRRIRAVEPGESHPLLGYGVDFG